MPTTPHVLPRQILDWVALLERLDAGDRDGLREHFLALDPDDRRLRFGLPVSDEHIRRYVDGIDLDADVVFGVCSGTGTWLGVGHLTLGREDAELGLSVLPDARGRGLGAAIFRFALAHASRAGVRRVYMHCLTSNRAILSIARAARMEIHSASGEADAYLVVPPYAQFVCMLIDEPATEH